MNIKVVSDKCPSCSLAIKGTIVSVVEAKSQGLFHGSFSIPLKRKNKRMTYKELKQVLDRRPGISVQM